MTRTSYGRVTLVAALASVLSLTTAAAEPSLSFVRLFGTARYESAAGVAMAPDGALYMAANVRRGRFESFTDGDVLLLKVSPSGELLWRRLIAGGESDRAADVAVAPDGTVYLIGTTFSGRFHDQENAGESDLFVVSFERDGTHRWTRLDGDCTSEAAVRAVATNDGVYVLGETRGSDIPCLSATGNGTEGPFGWLVTTVTHFGADGVRTWSRAFAPATNTHAGGLALGVDAVYFSASGDDGKTTHKSDVFVASLDLDGAERWVRRFGGRQFDNAVDIALSGKSIIALSRSALGSRFSYRVVRFAIEGGRRRMVIFTTDEVYERLVAVGPGRLALVGSGPRPPGDAGADDQAAIVRFMGPTSPLGSRVVNGPGTEVATGVAMGAAGAIYMAGDTTSAELGGATNHGRTDVFLARFE